MPLPFLIRQSAAESSAEQVAMSELRVLLVADRRLEQDRRLGDLHHLANLLKRHLQLAGQLFRRRLATDLAPTAQAYQPAGGMAGPSPSGEEGGASEGFHRRPVAQSKTRSPS
jgi:hypothetical protein